MKGAHIECNNKMEMGKQLESLTSTRMHWGTEYTMFTD